MAQSSPASQNPYLEELPRKLAWLVGFRATLASVLLLSTLLAAFRAGGSIRAEGARSVLLVVGCAYLAAALSVVAMRRVTRWVAFTYGQLAVDLALWSALAYVTGGPGSYFVYLLHMVVLLAAVYLGVRGTIGIAGAALMIYLAMAAGLGRGWLPWPAGFDAPAAAGGGAAVWSVRRLAPDVVSIIGVAALAAFLAYRAQQVARGYAAAERARADLRVRGEFILRSLPIGVVTTDLEGRIRSANPEAERLLGRLPERLYGEVAAVVLGLPRAAEPRGSESGELLLEDSEGRSSSVEYATGTLRDATGAPIGSLWILRDVTEIVSIRRELDHSERLSALGKLAAGLAHEIRNPLGAIRGAAELLRSPSDAAEAARLATVLVREVDRVSDLVGQLLTLVKPQTADRRPVSLTTLVDEVVTLARRDPRSELAQIKVSIAQEPALEADAAQIRQALWNLVRNAVQAVAEGGTVRIAATPVDGGVELSVDDSGPGVPEGDRDRVFDLFYTDKPFGIGVGLAVCRQVVTAHGGRISVAASDLGGASFRMFLPHGRPSTPIPPVPAGELAAGAD